MNGKNDPLFLKVNLKDHGYTYIWSPPSYKIDEAIIDSALPILDKKLREPCIGYTATRLGTNKYLLIAGSHWNGYKDQHGRTGLSFWCGAVVDDFGKNLDVSWRLSDYMLGMLKQLDVHYDQVGDIVSDLATKKQEEEEWFDVVLKLMIQVPTSIDDFTKKIIKSFIDNRKQIFSSEKINIQSSFPLHSRMVVPCMLGLLFLEPEINKIGGGNLLDSHIKDVRVISTSFDVKGYKKIEINKFLKTPFIFEKESRQPNLRIGDGDSQKSAFSVFFLIALILLILCLLGFIAFRFLR